MADDSQAQLPDWATVKLGNGVTHSRYARHVRIEQLSHSIKGRYTIGPAAVDHRPPLYDMPVEEVTRQTSSSASFETRSSAIAVEVWIMGDQDQLDANGELTHASTHRKGPNSSLTKDGQMVSRNKPVSVAAKSYMGRIQMSIVSRRGDCVDLVPASLTCRLDPSLVTSHNIPLRAHCIYEQNLTTAPCTFSSHRHFPD